MSSALICFPQGWLWQGAVAVTFFVLADMLDGQMAKMSGTASRWGAFLDSTLDRLGDAAVFGGILWYFAYVRDQPVWALVSSGGPDLRAAHLLRESPGREPRLRR